MQATVTTIERQLKQVTFFQLVDSRSIGGIETHMLNLCCWLNKQGYQVTFLLLQDYGAPHPLQPCLQQAGIFYRVLTGSAMLYRLLKQQPCLLATHGYKAGLIGRLVGKLCRVPVVSTYHSGDQGTGRLRVYTWLDELSASLAQQTIAVSPQIHQRLSGLATLIPNFVATTQSPPSTGKQIAFVGRLSHEKGPDLFINVTSGLARYYPPQHSYAHIYGDGVLRHTLSHAKHLHWHGNVAMTQHWQNIGLLCITSRYEGLPLAALEAMAHGIPVVSFSVGALPQLIESGRNGWLIPCDDLAAFHATIQTWLCLSCTEKREMAYAAQHSIQQHYSSDVICPRILEVYSKALQQHSPLQALPDKGVT